MDFLKVKEIISKEANFMGMEILEESESDIMAKLSKDNNFIYIHAYDDGMLASYSNNKVQIDYCLNYEEEENLTYLNLPSYLHFYKDYILNAEKLHVHLSDLDTLSQSLDFKSHDYKNVSVAMKQALLKEILGFRNTNVTLLTLNKE